MQTTTQKLAMTSLEYEMMLFGFYSRWCESVTLNTGQYQQVLANSAINAWFLMELAKLEADFNELTDRYVDGTITATDFKTCYHDCTYKMFNIRPAALLQTIKTKGSMSLRSNGVPVFTALNQN
jgi:hypothetical protein